MRRTLGRIQESATVTEAEKPTDEWQGIHLTRSMRLRLSGLTFTLKDDGTIESSDVEVDLSIDMYVYWLEIAFERLAAAEAAHAHLLDTWTKDDEASAAALERDCRESMQCIVASAIAIDAFYAMVGDHVKILERTREAWRRNRTPRPKQVAEVLRRAFEIGPKSFAQIRHHIVEVFAWRDKAVHPAAGYDQPVRYDELHVATEWRLVAFRAENAKNALAVALSLIAQLLERPRPKHASLTEHCAGSVQFVAPLVEQWEAKYGQLYERGQRGSA